MSDLLMKINGSAILAGVPLRTAEAWRVAGPVPLTCTPAVTVVAGVATGIGAEKVVDEVADHVAEGNLPPIQMS